MKILLAAALIAVAAPVAAQTAPAPAPAPAPTAAPTPAAKFSLDTPLETLVADPAAKAVLLKDMGGDITQHPMYASFKTMSLNSIAPLSGGAMSDDVLKKIGEDLASLK